MKQAPQSIELEKAVIGAMMLDRDAVTSAIDILHPDSFYLDTHRQIFTAIQQLFAQSSAIDLLTVFEQIKRNGVNIPLHELSEITSSVGSSAHIENHARIITQKHIQRELIRLGHDLTKDGYDESIDVFDLLDQTEANLFKVAQQNLKREIKALPELTITAHKELEALIKGDKPPGVMSGYTDLDNITHGWQKSDLIIIAGRPAMGKTAFALSVARNVANLHSVAIFSLEMSDVQLAKRLISAEAQVEGDKLRSGNIREDEIKRLNDANNKLGELRMFIDDTPAISIFELRAKCRRLKMKHDIGLVLIDYLQLMTGEKTNNREQEISTISRNLKAIAKEINVPVIALSQLSRKVEERSDKRPLLSDLRESGAIEQDADLVMFLYRAEYYGITEDANGNNVVGLAEVNIAKHRNGKTGKVMLEFEDKYARFRNLQDRNMGFDDDYPVPF